MEKRERSMSSFFKTYIQGAICWILTVTILSAPLVSCNFAFNTPVVVSAPTILTGNEEISTVEKDSVKSSVVNVVDFKSLETIETQEQRIIVEVDGSKTGFAIPEDSEREHFRNVFPNLSRVSSDSGETITETINGLDFILDTTNPLSEADKLVYTKAIQNIANNEDFNVDEIAAEVNASIDLSGVEDDIQSILDSNERFAILSRNSADELTEEDIAALTSAVQQAFDARAPLMAAQVLPVAENMSSSGNQVLINTLNSPVEGMEEAAARTLMAANKDNSRVLTSAPQLASSREALYKILVSGNSAQSGDLLYTYGPGLGDLITGHGAIWNKDNTSFLTADVPTGEKITGAKTTYYSPEHQTINKTKDTAMKLLHVTSPKTEAERSAAVKAAYNKYNGRKYMIQLIKSYDSSSLYCTQVAWLTWRSLGVDIDGTWGPTSFVVQNLVKKTVPATIVIGKSSVTIYVTIFVLVVTVLTMDIIYPWDMVIDNDTSEYVRFGKANPGI